MSSMKWCRWKFRNNSLKNEKLKRYEHKRDCHHRHVEQRIFRFLWKKYENCLIASYGDIICTCRYIIFQDFLFAHILITMILLDKRIEWISTRRDKGRENTLKIALTEPYTKWKWEEVSFPLNYENWAKVKSCAWLVVFISSAGLKEIVKLSES